MGINMTISLQPDEAAEVVNRAIVDGSITGELIDSYAVKGETGAMCVVSVYEKHYYRAGNRLTLTVVIDNMRGATRVHSISGGGGEGFVRFDWGAADSFESCVHDALVQFIVSEN